MAKSSPKQTPVSVTDFIAQLAAPLSDLVAAIRQTVLGTDESIGEQIKWNSPSFYYTGPMQPFDPKAYSRDLLVVNLHRGYALLVFPTGARIEDASGILEGSYTDGRRMVTLKTMEELRAKTPALQGVIRAWLQGVDRSG